MGVRKLKSESAGIELGLSPITDGTWSIFVSSSPKAGSYSYGHFESKSEGMKVLVRLRKRLELKDASIALHDAMKPFILAAMRE